MKKEATRRAYWARSFAAWSYQTKCKPNITHYTLAKWEDQGKVNFVYINKIGYFKTAQIALIFSNPRKDQLLGHPERRPPPSQGWF